MKKRITAIASFLIVGLLLIGTAIAYRGDFSVEGPNHDPETHELIEAAMDSGDYAEYMRIREENGLPVRGRIFQALNEENFHRFVELHEAREAGDTETAEQIMAEFGAGQGKMLGNGRSGMGKEAGYGLNRGQKQGGGSGGMQGKGSPQNRMQNFVDTDNDGTCDRLQ